jgi:hypothetical protein
MSEVKHTPGPWVLQKRDENIFRIVSSCVWEWDIATVDNDVDCIRGGTNEDGISLQSIANAKLIAAAPDMLSALQQIAKGQDGETKSDFIQRMICLAEEVIEIATT